MAKFEVGDWVIDSFGDYARIVEVLPVGPSGRQGYRIKPNGIGSGSPSEWEQDLTPIQGYRGAHKQGEKSIKSLRAKYSKTFAMRTGRIDRRT